MGEEITDGVPNLLGVGGGGVGDTGGVGVIGGVGDAGGVCVSSATIA
jgi:hypothetical protein